MAAFILSASPRLTMLKMDKAQVGIEAEEMKSCCRIKKQIMDAQATVPMTDCSHGTSDEKDDCKGCDLRCSTAYSFVLQTGDSYALNFFPQDFHRNLISYRNLYQRDFLSGIDRPPIV